MASTQSMITLTGFNTAAAALRCGFFEQRKLWMPRIASIGNLVKCDNNRGKNRWCFDNAILFRRLGVVGHSATPDLAASRAARDDVGRPSTPQMNSPAAISLRISTPVSMPRPSSMYSTSSLATLPVAPFA